MPDPKDLFDLTGRVAVVTGGSRGLGREMVLAMAAVGADVVISSRKLDSCEALAEEVRSTTGRRALAVAAHAARWDDMDALAEAAYAEFGQVDVLVNNAGLSPLYDDVTDGDGGAVGQDARRQPQGRLPPDRPGRLADGQAGRGSIINVSSVAARYPKPEVIPYAAAKAGLNAMTQAFAHTWGPTVRVNAILPGSFLTDISKAWDPDAFAAEAAGYAMGRGGRPEEIVGAALYLASDASSFTTGALLDVDGGYRP